MTDKEIEKVEEITEEKVEVEETILEDREEDVEDVEDVEENEEEGADVGEDIGVEDPTPTPPTITVPIPSSVHETLIPPVPDVSVDMSVDALYNEFVKIVGTDKLTTLNVVTMTVYLMQIVERYDTISGIQKKHTVLRVLNKFIDEEMEDGDDKQAVKLLVVMTLPGVIDSFVALDRSEIMIKAKNAIAGCCGCGGGKSGKSGKGEKGKGESG